MGIPKRGISRNSSLETAVIRFEKPFGQVADGIRYEGRGITRGRKRIFVTGFRLLRSGDRGQEAKGQNKNYQRTGESELATPRVRSMMIAMHLHPLCGSRRRVRSFPGAAPEPESIPNALGISRCGRVRWPNFLGTKAGRSRGGGRARHARESQAQRAPRLLGL